MECLCLHLDIEHLLCARAPSATALGDTRAERCKCHGGGSGSGSANVREVPLRLYRKLSSRHRQYATRGGGGEHEGNLRNCARWCSRQRCALLVLARYRRLYRIAAMRERNNATPHQSSPKRDAGVLSNVICGFIIFRRLPRRATAPYV